MWVPKFGCSLATLIARIGSTRCFQNIPRRYRVARLPSVYFRTVRDEGLLRTLANPKFDSVESRARVLGNAHGPLSPIASLKRRDIPPPLSLRVFLVSLAFPALLFCYFPSHSLACLSRLEMFHKRRNYGGRIIRERSSNCESNV